MSEKKKAGYCIYKSDPFATQFYWIDDAKDEQDGRSKMLWYLYENSLMEDCRVDKFINLFLFKGKDNITGKMVFNLTLHTRNRQA